MRRNRRTKPKKPEKISDAALRIILADNAGYQDRSGPSNVVMDDAAVGVAWDFFNQLTGSKERLKYLAEYVAANGPEQLKETINNFPTDWVPGTTAFKAWLLMRGNKIPSTAQVSFISSLNDLVKRVPEVAFATEKAEEAKFAKIKPKFLPGEAKKFNLELYRVDRSLKAMQQWIRSMELNSDTLHEIRNMLKKRDEDLTWIMSGDPDAMSLIREQARNRHESVLSALTVEHQRQRTLGELALEVINDLLSSAPRPSKPGRVHKQREIKPEKVVSKVKYLPFNEETGSNSLDPTKVIGKEVLYAYKAKVREIVVFVAKTGETLSFNGTSVIGYDEKLSTQKKIRKPKETVTALLAAGKRDAAKLYDELSTKAAPLFTNRTNETVQFIKVF